MLFDNSFEPLTVPKAKLPKARRKRHAKGTDVHGQMLMEIAHTQHKPSKDFKRQACYDLQATTAKLSTDSAFGTGGQMRHAPP